MMIKVMALNLTTKNTQFVFHIFLHAHYHSYTFNAGMKFANLQSESVVGLLGALYFVGVTGRGPYLLGSALLYIFKLHKT